MDVQTIAIMSLTAALIVVVLTLIYLSASIGFLRSKVALHEVRLQWLYHQIKSLQEKG